MRSPTKYKFRHYRPDGDGVSKLIWASDGPGRSGDLNDGIVKGSELDLEVIRSQMWTPNELSNAGEVAMLEAFFGTGAAPTPLYFRLWATTLTDTATLATATEVTGTDYTTECTGTAMVKDTDWGVVTHDSGTLSTTQTFTGGAGGWTGAVDLALCDADTGTTGDLIAYAALSTTRTLLENDTLDVSMAVSLE